MSIETINYRGFDINIEQDMDAENPWESWDGNPPMYVFRPMNETIEYGLPFNVPCPTREQIRINSKAIAEELGCDTLLRACTANTTYESSVCFYGSHEPGCERVYHALCEYALSLNKTDLMDFLEKLYSWQGIVALSTSCNPGFAQSDWCELLIVATPEWLKETGAIINGPDDLISYADLYAAWAFGDVYGFVIPETDDSCWGFYGSDHRESGLLEMAEDSIDCEIERRAVEKQASEVMLLTSCGGVG